MDSRGLERLSSRVGDWAGSSIAFLLAILAVVLWLCAGPWCHYSDTWQLVINTSTTIITFLMVFLIQRAQNKSSLAIQLKLDEIVAGIQGASNRLIDVEDLSESELRRLQERYQQVAERLRTDVEQRD